MAHSLFRLLWKRSIYKSSPLQTILHSDLPNIMPVATKVHVILRRPIVLTWMHDIRDFSVVVHYGIMPNLMIQYMRHG